MTIGDAQQTGKSHFCANPIVAPNQLVLIDHCAEQETNTKFNQKIIRHNKFGPHRLLTQEYIL
jgi:hypothetical protein